MKINYFGIITYFVLGTALPLLLWCTLYFAVRWWSLKLRPILPWITAFRWVGWIASIIVALFSIVGHSSLLYALIPLVFSSGVAIPQSWAKRRIATDLVN